MPQTGICTDLTCNNELTELYECHCCNWLICLKHLLEHVQVSKRDKQIQLERLRNELVSISYTLELIVENKLHEIEREKQLIHQAKVILDKSECTVEEIEAVSNDINRAIGANRKGSEEMVVKVESSLTDNRTSTSNNDTLNLTNLFSPSNDVLQRPLSPTFISVRARISLSENSSAPISNDRSTKVKQIFRVNSSNDENIDPQGSESSSNPNTCKNIYPPCPLTFDGAFGVTKEKHSLELCPLDNNIRRNLVGHLTWKHKLKKIYARRLVQAVQNNKDPKTKLFRENEDIIDHEHFISCPFSNRMIHLIGCCPTESRKVPCQLKSIQSLYLVNHMVKHHSLSTETAREIAQNYREKLKNEHIEC